MPKMPRGGVFVRGVTEIRKNEASAVPSAHFDYISGRVRAEIEKEIQQNGKKPSEKSEGFQH